MKNPRKRKAASEVFSAFLGPPKKRDPSHVKLREMGWAMTQRVFHPTDVWLTKDANAFMAKNLTLIPEQKRELEIDLVQESFLKDFEKVPGYKANFEFKNKMFPSMKSQRTSLVTLFKLRDAVTRVKLQVDDTLDSCGAVALPDDSPEAGYSSWGQEAVSAVFKPLQSPPQVDIKVDKDELELENLDLDPNTMAVIQERAQKKLDKNK